MKKIILTISVLAVLALPTKVMANDSQDTVICPQPYGGGVVCGVHTPVETGIGDNLGLIGSGLIMASGVVSYLSKKYRLAD